MSPPKKTLRPLFPAGEELVNCIHKSETNDLKRQMMLVKLQATMGCWIGDFSSGFHDFD